jgi:GrpB-like predicted nucleotidyltransferase (UPF0157 family)
VRLAEYDARWAELYSEEAARVTAVLAPLSLSLEHIGSTSVPALVAKPVLDLLAGYEDPSLIPAYVAALSEAGYRHRGEQGIPGREFFRRGTPRAYHLHLTHIGAGFWQDQLLFRNLLRTDPPLRASYAALKRELAARYPRDREAYIEGKGPFIRAALDRARRAE